MRLFDWSGCDGHISLVPIGKFKAKETKEAKEAKEIILSNSVFFHEVRALLLTSFYEEMDVIDSKILYHKDLLPHSDSLWLSISLFTACGHLPSYNTALDKKSSLEGKMQECLAISSINKLLDFLDSLSNVNLYDWQNKLLTMLQKYMDSYCVGESLREQINTRKILSALHSFGM